MDNSGFEYVNISGEQYKGCINLFFDGRIIALITDIEFASKIKERIDNEKSD